MNEQDQIDDACCDIVSVSSEFMLARGESASVFGKHFGIGIKNFRIILSLA